MDKVAAFIETRGKALEFSEALHIIWSVSRTYPDRNPFLTYPYRYCIPTDAIRPVSGEELRFFEINTGKGECRPDGVIKLVASVDLAPASPSRRRFHEIRWTGDCCFQLSPRAWPQHSSRQPGDGPQVADTSQGEVGEADRRSGAPPIITRLPEK